MNEASGRCLDGALAHPGQKAYSHSCVPHKKIGDAVGQTWLFVGDSGEIINVAAKTCMAAQADGSVVIAMCTPAEAGVAVSDSKLQWKVTAVAAPGPGQGLDFYNVSSSSETHWPAVHAGGWLMEVDTVAKTVRWPITARGPAMGQPTKLAPWLNPLSNGQKLPAAPDCTMLHGGNTLLCKTPLVPATVFSTVFRLLFG